MSGTLIQLPHERAFNFSAGPGALPLEVLEQAREEIFNFRGTGVSVMEMSHRSKPFEALLEETIQGLRTLLKIPDNYKILFLQGGASLQFTMLPMNLRPAGASADYLVTGTWGKKAVEAAKLGGGAVNVVYDAKASNYDRCPKLADFKPSVGSAYIHFTSNETIQGVDYFEDPSTEGTWVCDMSSNILSRPVDVSKYAMIYAGAQKNMGPAGVTIVVIREDLLAGIPEGLPPMLDYRLQAENNSLYNTPPCWSIYICGLVYQYLIKHGGIPAMQALNEKKAKLIYDVIDGSSFYKGHAQQENRSQMNITWTLPNDELTVEFIKGAKELKMLELKGHRSVGGCRASTYNAVPLEACQALAEYMRDFESRNG